MACFMEYRAVDPSPIVWQRERIAVVWVADLRTPMGIKSGLGIRVVSDGVADSRECL